MSDDDSDRYEDMVAREMAADAHEDVCKERDDLAARLRMAEEAIRHVRWRNHPHSAGCDACLAAEILAWPPEALSDPKGTP